MDKELQRISNAMRQSQMNSTPSDFVYDPETGVFVEASEDSIAEGNVVTKMTEDGWA